MAKRNPDLEMYAVLDPRVTLLNELRNAHYERSHEAIRREAQWPTWQTDRSWPDAAAVRMPVDRASRTAAPHDSLPWTLGAAGFLALGIIAAGLLTVGIERGLL